MTYWSYGLDVIILHGPFLATGLHVQHASLPDVPMMYHNSTNQQKPIIHIKKKPEFKEENKSFVLKTCEFPNLMWKPIASTLLPPHLKNPAVFHKKENILNPF